MRTTMICVDMEILEPWGVGGVAGVKDAIDLPVQVDPRGGEHRPYVPSTSLVGALRRHLGKEKSLRWFGAPPGPYEESTGEVKLTPSPVRVLGSRVVSGGVLTEFGATAVDPHRRAAASGTLRTERRVEVMPASVEGGGPTRLSWYLQHDGDVDEELLGALARWQPFVGRRRSTGHGQACVTGVSAFTVDLHTEAGLTWWLADRAAWLAGTGAPPSHATIETREGESLRQPAWERTFVWRVVEPIHVGVSGETQTRDNVAESAAGRTVLTQRTADGVPLVPGTSWKGVFRHRVEHILRLSGAAEQQISGLTKALFGAKGTRGSAVTGHRGCLRFSDTPLTEPGGGRAAARVVRTHVAIDRVSGGAHEGLLFAVDAVNEGAEATLVLSSAAKLPESVENLLLHVVRDIHDGFVGVGAGSTRGYGWLELTTDAPAVSPIHAEDMKEFVARAATPTVKMDVTP